LLTLNKGERLAIGPRQVERSTLQNEGAIRLPSAEVHLYPQRYLSLSLHGTLDPRARR